MATDYKELAASYKGAMERAEEMTREVRGDLVHVRGCLEAERVFSRRIVHELKEARAQIAALETFLAGVAQLEERLSCKQSVGGSIPPASSLPPVITQDLSDKS